MNRKQIAALWIGIVLAVLMALFPPYLPQIAPRSAVEYAYAFLFAPPVGSAGIDAVRLTLQFVLVLLPTRGAVATLRSPDRRTL